MIPLAIGAVPARAHLIFTPPPASCRVSPSIRYGAAKRWIVRGGTAFFADPHSKRLGIQRQHGLASQSFRRQRPCFSGSRVGKARSFHPLTVMVTALIAAAHLAQFRVSGFRLLAGEPMPSSPSPQAASRLVARTTRKRICMLLLPPERVGDSTDSTSSSQDVR